MITTEHMIQHNQKEYEENFLPNIQNKFDELTQGEEFSGLFTTTAKNLFETFLDGFDTSEIRQHYNCNTCRKFVNDFGGLVTIVNGKIIPVMWTNEVPKIYKKSVKNVITKIKKSKVNGVFYSSDENLGKFETDEWNHMAVNFDNLKFTHPLKNNTQQMAEKKQDYITLVNSLSLFSFDDVKQALLILRTDSVYRSEKALGVAQWLVNLYKKRNKNKLRDNLTWVAVANAPAGFCHVKTTMLGSLLSDISYGYTFDVIKRRWQDKMKPTQYQRPQVAPSEGTIKQAETIFSKMGLEKSLERRFARFDEVELIWKQQLVETNRDSLFAHIKAKETKVISKLDMPTITMTWEKFNKVVIATAQNIEFLVPSGRESYTALVTAKDIDAPPILQWDNEIKRNQVSHYAYVDGSFALHWGLNIGEYRSVKGICFLPHMWNNFRSINQTYGVIFILENVMDNEGKQCGNALFPEIMRSELHGVRAVIEAYSKDAILGSVDREIAACGIGLHKGVTHWNNIFKVTTFDGDVLNYRIDRWD